MRGLEPPAKDLWRSRNDWFWQAHDVNAGPAFRAALAVRKHETRIRVFEK